MPKDPLKSSLAAKLSADRYQKILLGIEMLNVALDKTFVYGNLLP